MAYTKNIWTSGDIVTSEKLNHIEDGINNIQEAVSMMEFGGSGSSVFLINAIESEDDGNHLLTLDKTWQEIYDAHISGTHCVVRRLSEDVQKGDGARVVGEELFTVTEVSKHDYIYENTTASYSEFIVGAGVDILNDSFVIDTPDGYPYMQLVSR